MLNLCKLRFQYTILSLLKETNQSRNLSAISQLNNIASNRHQIKLLWFPTGLRYFSQSNFEITNFTKYSLQSYERIVINSKKEAYAKSNNFKLRSLRDQCSKELDKKHNVDNIIEFTKFTIMLSDDEALKKKLLEVIIKEISSMDFASLLEIGWYFCLLDNREHQAEFFKTYIKQLNAKLPKDLHKKTVSVHQKVQLSQIIFNMRLIVPLDSHILDECSILQTLEHIALDEFTLGFYQGVADLLEINGIKVARICHFTEIYNTGIELENKVIIDLYDLLNRQQDVFIYKAIKYKNLKDMGYTVHSVGIQTQNSDKKLVVDKIIAQLQNKDVKIMKRQ